MCVERVYLVFISLLLVNVAMLIVMFAENDYQNSMQRVYETIVMFISPIFWLCNMGFVYYFLRMARSYLDNMEEMYHVNKCRAMTLFWAVGLMQIYSMIADDFIMLFLCGYIFEDLDLIVKYLPTIDFIMTVLSEQINPLNALFVLLLLNFFASLEGGKNGEKSKDESSDSSDSQSINMSEGKEIEEINLDIEKEDGAGEEPLNRAST